MSRRFQFSLKMILWLTLAVAMVLTGWALVDEVSAAAQSGELPYASLLWMSVAYLVTFIGLSAMRGRL